MSQIIRKINEFFKFSLKSEIDMVKSKVILTDRQEKIFTMFYLEKRPIDFIADSLFVSIMTVNNELKTIRRKLIKVLL